MDIGEIRTFFEGDRFALDCGIRIDEASPGTSLCSVALEPGHRNAAGAVQGGLIFTLADFAFAVAANCEACGSGGTVTVSLSNSITFCRPARGARLSARARLLSSTRRTCLCQVDVSDELGTAVAHMTVNGFVTAVK